MKFLSKIILTNFGATTEVMVNSSCKADGG